MTVRWAAQRETIGHLVLLNDYKNTRISVNAAYMPDGPLKAVARVLNYVKGKLGVRWSPMLSGRCSGFLGFEF